MAERPKRRTALAVIVALVVYLLFRLIVGIPIIMLAMRSGLPTTGAVPFFVTVAIGIAAVFVSRWVADRTARDYDRSGPFWAFVIVAFAGCTQVQWTAGTWPWNLGSLAIFLSAAWFAFERRAPQEARTTPEQ